MWYVFYFNAFPGRYATQDTMEVKALLAEFRCICVAQSTWNKCYKIIGPTR